MLLEPKEHKSGASPKSWEEVRGFGDLGKVRNTGTVNDSHFFTEILEPLYYQRANGE